MMHVHTTGNYNVTTKIAAEFLVGECTFKEYEQMTLKSSGVNTMNSTGDENKTKDTPSIEVCLRRLRSNTCESHRKQERRR